MPERATYYADVKPILDARCINCHVSGGVAPFALDSYASAKLYAGAANDAVQTGKMPPWHAEPSPDVSYLRDPSLSAAQKATIAAWVAAQMPEGDSKHPGTPLTPVGGGLTRVDTTLTMKEPYTPMVSPDDYRCFVLTWPGEKPQYITGVNALPGVAPQVHHIAMYMVPPDSANLPARWDAEDSTPGYQCFGGPFGNRPQEFAVNVLTAWIPGYSGTTLPRGGGIRIDPGTTIVMQVHYNLQTLGAPQADQTAMQFQLADSVPVTLAYQPLLDVAWVAGQMKIPANATNVSFQYGADPREFFKLLGSPLDTTKSPYPLGTFTGRTNTSSRSRCFSSQVTSFV